MRIPKPPNYILIILLGIIAFSVYINALNGDFLVDDEQAILNNPRIHDIRVYLRQHFSARGGSLYELMLSLNWHIWGGRPYFYHLCNVSVHAACAVLVFILCNILFKERALSFLSGLIFAIHPIHTEAVSWISGGHYALSSLFFIAAFIFYARAGRSIPNLLFTIIFFALCLLAGNTVSALPLMFIVYDLFFRQKEEEDKASRRTRFLTLVLMSLVCVIFIGVFFAGRNKFMRLIFYYRGIKYLVVIAKALVYYLKILYLPLERGLFHPFAFDRFDIQNLNGAFYISLVIICVLLFFFFKCRRSRPAVSFGIAWFFVAYLPYSNIIPVCNIISERYLYLPSLGFSILLAALFLEAWKIINRNKAYQKALRVTALAAVVLFLGAYACLTIKRNYEYRNIFTYWESNVRNFPDGYRVYNNLAGTFYMMGNYHNAIAYCLINLSANPHQPHAWCNLGRAYRQIGDIKEARKSYQEALKIDKNYFPAIEAIVIIDKELKANP